MELFELGIREAQEGLEKGEFSSVELTQAIIDRYHAKNGEIGAYLTFDEEGALKLAKEADEALARQYDELLKDSFVPFMRAIRAAFPPETPGYFCCCNQDAHHAYVLAKTLAAPGQRPVIRINNAIYVCGNDPQQMPRVLSQTARQIADIRGEATILCENDPCPQNRNALGAVPLANQLVMSLLEGCDGAKIWPFRGHNTHERKSFEAYRACFASVRGAVDAVRAMKLRRTGVVIPLPKERPFSVWLSYDPQDWSTRYFARVGIPFRFGAPGADDVVALTDADLAYFGDAELERLLAGRVLLDGSAAIGLAKRGFGPLIGVEAKPWEGKPISLERYDFGVLNGGTSASADLTARAAEAVVRSRLFHRASPLSPECEEVGPGSILFRNRLGGCVFTIAASLPKSRPNLTQWYYYNETRKLAVLAAIRELGGAEALSAYYPDDAETIFETGVAADGANVFVFDNLGIDTLENPEVVFAQAPGKVERLGNDGRWQPVEFDDLGDGRCRLKGTRVETLRPAVFRWRSLLDSLPWIGDGRPVREGADWKRPSKPLPLMVVPGSVLDLSDLPAESAGPVTIRDGRFVGVDGRPVRFFADAQVIFRRITGFWAHKPEFDTDERIEAFVGELKRRGFNMVRSHFTDATLMMGSSSTGLALRMASLMAMEPVT